MDIDVASAESQLNMLIERRARQIEAEREREALWEASVRAYNERHRREMRAAWYGYHMDQAERIERAAAAIAAEHREKALALLEEHRGRVSADGPM